MKIDFIKKYALKRIRFISIFHIQKKTIFIGNLVRDEILALHKKEYILPKGEEIKYKNAVYLMLSMSFF